MKSRHGLTVLLLGVLATTARGEEAVDFNEKVLPILRQRCFECHSHSAKIRGGLALDSRSGWQKGGDNGPAIVPGDPDKSLLIKAVRRVSTDLEMPPKAKLPAEEIAILERWVKAGASDPRGDDGAKASRTIDLEEGKRFWCFQPIADPPLPQVRGSAWPFDPLDRFILAKLETATLHPVADATRHTWLRRVTLDLTGLPPTPGEIAAFVQDTSSKAYEKVVDRLLASKGYGERWARHWLDLTGYADMMGTSNNVYAEHAWRYRDYLIAAFNKDKPFNQFVREQIAGDLMPAISVKDRAEKITATGFLMVGDIEIVNPDKAKMEADHIDSQVIKIGQAFLGMTLGCVRCHDHKFDPIGLEDYYGIAGVLRSSPSSHKIPFGVWSSLNTSDLPETPAQLEARRKVEAEIVDRIARVKGEQKKLADGKAAVQKQLAASEGKEGVDKDSLAKRSDEIDAQLKKLAGDITHAEFFQSKAPKAFAMHNSEKPGDMPIYIRGNPYAPSTIVPRGALRVASWAKFTDIPSGQSGRLQLADWLADKRNPLTARVAVNRIWQKLFGVGLVPSVDYFGVRGDRPTNPELLDHLATRFMQGGWSQKALLRSLVLSRTYRLSSANDATAMKIDPENNLFWRMNRQRLEAEALRDAMLAISGELLRDSGGPALVLEYPENCAALVKSGVNPPNYRHTRPRPSQEFERTIYLPVMRLGFARSDNLRGVFDFIDPAMIAGQRSQTIVPTQLLFLLNNELVRKRSEALAKMILVEEKENSARLDRLWLQVLNRPITPAEREEALALLGHVASESSEATAWCELCHSLLASNEFVFRL